MREMLVPIFGSGAVVAQFVITLIVVLALVAGLVWLVRRYGANALGGSVPRSRAPRLAVVDALAVDGRRRLVLVRRDNVEHLILIGGPTDIVVEPTIVRGVSAAARQRQGQMRTSPQQPAPQQAVADERAVEAEPNPPPTPARRAELQGGSEPIPFPQPARVEEMEPTRPPPPPPQPSRPPVEIRRVPPGPRAVSGHFAETSRPTRIESVFSLADALDEIADEPPASPSTPFEPARAAAVEASAENALPPIEPDDVLPEYLTLADNEAAPATAAEEFAEGPPEPAGPPSRVSDLEREMARLLGEITSKRGG